MSGSLLLKLKSFTVKLLSAVIKIVTAIRNSVQLREKLMMLSVLNARVMEWPIVNAVTSTSIFRHSLKV